METKNITNSKYQIWTGWKYQFIFFIFLHTTDNPEFRLQDSGIGKNSALATNFSQHSVHSEFPPVKSDYLYIKYNFKHKPTFSSPETGKVSSICTIFCISRKRCFSSETSRIKLACSRSRFFFSMTNRCFSISRRLHSSWLEFFNNKISDNLKMSYKFTFGRNYVLHNTRVKASTIMWCLRIIKSTVLLTQTEKVTKD